MPEAPLENKFHAVAIMNDLNFELRGDGAPVGLSFEPDEAYVFRAILTRAEGITTGDIGREQGFRQLCGVEWNPYNYTTDVVNYCRTIIHSLEFTCRVLKSALILRQEDGIVRRRHRSYRATVYSRNPVYAVVDERQT